LIADGVDGLGAILDVEGAPVAVRQDMEGVLWSKLLLNLNNALNALSGLPLARELADRRWRRLLAEQMDEGLAVLKAARIRPTPLEGVSPRLIALAMRLPDLPFQLAARRILALDPEARSSMSEDLERRRPTEIDHLQGEILALAGKVGLRAPVVERVAHLVKDAEAAGEGSPRLQPDEIANGR
jgi:2-dehydropantoate 2-reductase